MRSLHSHTTRAKQRGAVSLFIVIFTALLVTTITISFLQLMMKDQQQATYSDLSESAYDSAMAGVEDAKRLLLLDDECRSGTAAVAVNCSTVESALTPSPGESATECDTLVRGGVVGGAGSETIIQQHVGDGAAQLDQAYTCVKISLNTDDFLGSFSSADSMALIPLRSVGAFDRVVISWSQSKNGGTFDVPSSSNMKLPEKDASAWPLNRPALLRAQLINGNGQPGFRLSDFDNSGFSNTLFLYPADAGISPFSFDLDGRLGGAPNAPQPVLCHENVASGDYACEIELTTSAPISAERSQAAFLGLAAFYNATDYKIQLKNGSDVVAFDRVQPEVDSTGRANDLFRRVVSRVELGNAFNYPTAALEIRNNICKHFSVTTDPNDYGPIPEVCDPTVSN